MTREVLAKVSSVGRDGLGRVGKDPVSSLRSETPAGERSKKGRGGYAVIKALLDALRSRGIPAPDERLKSIVGAQINALLKGGYDAAMVRHFALELGLSWDNAKGHQRLLGLRQAVLQADAEREYAAHEARMAAVSDLSAVDPTVAIAFLNAAKHRQGQRPIAGWAVNCAAPDCKRTAVYGSTTCSDHSR